MPEHRETIVSLGSEGPSRRGRICTRNRWPAAQTRRPPAQAERAIPSFRTSRANEIHMVLDNLSARKTKEIHGFLTEHPRVRFHFTPTYSSWLNQVELWFAKIQRDVFRRGVLTSVGDLGNKLRRYIRLCSKLAKPFCWTYTDHSRQIRPDTIAGTVY